MLDLIHRLRSRPIHVRRRIALATSGAVTGLVAVVWITASVALGTFSTATPDAAPAVAADIGTSFAAARSQTASALSAAAAGTSTPATSGGLTIVETKQTSSLVQVDPSTRTVIPF